MADFYSRQIDLAIHKLECNCCHTVVDFTDELPQCEGCGQIDWEEVYL